MQGIDRYNRYISEVERAFIGQPYASLLLIKSLITVVNSSTGVVKNISYNELAKTLTVNPAPGRKNSGTPTKQTIRNYIRSLEKECGDHFKVVTEGQKLQFLFPNLPKIFNKFFPGVNTGLNFDNPIENIEQTQGSDDTGTTILNTEINTASHNVENINIFNITNLNKQNLTVSNDFSCCKKQIVGDFHPNQKTIEMALSMGLTKVTDFTEIQAFIKHNKKLKTQWADFNPVFITWLERDAQYTKNKQQKAYGQLRSNHNERGTNQSTLSQTALERVSQQHGISIDSLWDNPSSNIYTSEFIAGTLIQPMDETDRNIRTAFYQ